MNNMELNEKFTLDNLDKKILFYLDKNSRQSASEIAKKCHVHKNVVNFRINRLVEKKIIKQFVAMISPSALGLIPYRIYLQLKNFTSKKEEELRLFIKKLPVYWSAKVSGRWDFVIGVLVQNQIEFQEINNKLLIHFGEDITDKTISILAEAPHFFRKYLTDNPDYSTKYWIKGGEKREIDELDSKILKILASNARTSIVDISEKVDTTVKTVLSRMRALEKSRIIYDYRISLNLEKIDYHFFKCLIFLKNAEKAELNRFLEYCKKNKNIIHLVECIGDWELEPEFEIESFDKFQEAISYMRDNFSSIIKNIETINILDEISYICIPEK